MRISVAPIGILLSLLTISQCYLLLTEPSLSRMIQLMEDKPYCYYYTDKEFIESTVRNTKEENLKITTESEIKEMCDLCRDKRIKTSYQGGFTYPGTKWCGPGTAAKFYDDLGKHVLVDMCCRDHDNCPQSFESGVCKQGLCNKSFFTRSHCDCDIQFQQCLQKAESETANTIGAIFFNVAEVICFKETDECVKKTRLVSQAISSATDNNCTLEFTKAGRYVPGDTRYYGTQGELIEKGFINRWLKKLNLL